MLVFIEHGTRRMHLSGVTPHPTGHRQACAPVRKVVLAGERLLGCGEDDVVARAEARRGDQAILPCLGRVGSSTRRSIGAQPGARR